MSDYQAFEEQRRAMMARNEASAYQGLMRTMKRVQRFDKAWKTILDPEDPLRKVSFEKPFGDKGRLILRLWHRQAKRRDYSGGYYDVNKYFDVYRMEFSVVLGKETVKQQRTQIKPEGRGLLPKIQEAETHLHAMFDAQVKAEREIKERTEKLVSRLKSALGPYYRPTDVDPTRVSLDIGPNGQLIPAQRSWGSAIQVSLQDDNTLDVQFRLHTSGDVTQKILGLIEGKAA